MHLISHFFNLWGKLMFLKKLWNTKKHCETLKFVIKQVTVISINYAYVEISDAFLFLSVVDSPFATQTSDFGECSWSSV